VTGDVGEEAFRMRRRLPGYMRAIRTMYFVVQQSSSEINVVTSLRCVPDTDPKLHNPGLYGVGM